MNQISLKLENIGFINPGGEIDIKKLIEDKFIDAWSSNVCENRVALIKNNIKTGLYDKIRSKIENKLFQMHEESIQKQMIELIYDSKTKKNPRKWCLNMKILMI